MCTGLCKLNTRTMQHGARFSLTLPALADIMSVAHSFPAYIAFVVIATIGPGSASSQLNSTTDVTMATRTVNLATLNYAERTTSFRPRDELKISYEEATIPDELSDSVSVDTVGITENGVMSKEQSCAKLYERFFLALSVFSNFVRIGNSRQHSLLHHSARQDLRLVSHQLHPLHHARRRPGHPQIL